MDNSTFNSAKAAYDAQQWETAAVLFSACQDGPGAGEASHLRGNALMRLGRVPEAVDAYRRATQDPSYPHRGAVFTNLGKAQVALGDYQGAISSLRSALEDGQYPGAYKTWLALGGAYSRLGDARNAGIAYRKAALEANNPDPAKALINLGVCFVQMRRPEDAASAYRTALDFSQDANERNMILSNLGQAYVASNRMLEAVQAFKDAVHDGYQLLPPAQEDYEKAKKHLEAAGQGTGQGLLASAASSGAYNPLDPAGHSGEMMPSPEESGFFDISEEQIESLSRGKNKKAGQQGKKKGGLVALISIVILLLVAIAICAALYLVKGVGFPSQESAVNTVFSAAERGSTSTDGWASGVSSGSVAEMMAQVPVGSSHAIRGLDYSASSPGSAEAYVVVTLPEGGTISYDVSLQRSGISWVVASVQTDSPAIDSSTYSQSSSAGSTSSTSTTSTATVPESATDPASTEAYLQIPAEGEVSVDYAAEGSTEEGVETAGDTGELAAA